MHHSLTSFPHSPSPPLFARPLRQRSQHHCLHPARRRAGAGVGPGAADAVAVRFLQETPPLPAPTPSRGREFATSTCLSSPCFLFLSPCARVYVFHLAPRLWPGNSSDCPWGALRAELVCVLDDPCCERAIEPFWWWSLALSFWLGRSNSNQSGGGSCCVGAPLVQLQGYKHSQKGGGNPR